MSYLQMEEVAIVNMDFLLINSNMREITDGQNFTSVGFDREVFLIYSYNKGQFNFISKMSGQFHSLTESEHNLCEDLKDFNSLYWHSILNLLHCCNIRKMNFHIVIKVRKFVQFLFLNEKLIVRDLSSSQQIVTNQMQHKIEISFVSYSSSIKYDSSEAKSSGVNIVCIVCGVVSGGRLLPIMRQNSTFTLPSICFMFLMLHHFILCIPQLIIVLSYLYYCCLLTFIQAL